MLELNVPIKQHCEEPEPGMTVHHYRVRADTTGVRTCTKMRDQTHCYLHTHLKQPKLVLSYIPSSSCTVTVVLKHIAGYRLGFQKPDGYIYYAEHVHIVHTKSSDSYSAFLHRNQGLSPQLAPANEGAGR